MGEKINLEKKLKSKPPQGISGKADQLSELYRLRELKEIGDIRDSNNRLVYGWETLDSLFYGYKKIFKSRPHWTLAEMLDYALAGRATDKKEKFVTAVLSKEGIDPEVISYVKRKSKGRYTLKELGIHTKQTANTERQKIDPKLIEAGLYLLPEIISSVSGMSVATVNGFAARVSSRELPGNRYALNLRPLVVLLEKIGYKPEAQRLFNFYMHARTG